MTNVISHIQLDVISSYRDFCEENPEGRVFISLHDALGRVPITKLVWKGISRCNRAKLIQEARAKLEVFLKDTDYILVSSLDPYFKEYDKAENKEYSYRLYFYIVKVKKKKKK